LAQRCYYLVAVDVVGHHVSYGELADGKPPRRLPSTIFTRLGATLVSRQANPVPDERGQGL
jgi:hypothetical protein